jgi:hypothetical protein
MFILWYVVALVCGAIGALGVLRTLERVIFGGGSGSLVFQFAFGMGFLFLAMRAVQRARRAQAGRAGPDDS